MRVYLTGAKGYLGSYLIYYLKLRNIHVFTNNCNLTDYNALLLEMKRVKPHVVIHLAGKHNCNNKRIALRDNSLILKNVVQIMKLSHCDKIIYASTQEVYGNSIIPSEETDTLFPSSTYAITKLLGEHIIVAQNINSIIFRMCNIASYNIYGTNNYNIFKHMLNLSLSKQIKTNQICNQVNYTTSYLSLDDTCAAYYMAACKMYNCLLSGHHVFNLCADRVYTIKKVVWYFNHTIKNKSKNNIAYKTITYMYNNDLINSNMCNTKVKKQLGWKAHYDLTDIIISYLL